MSIVLSDSTKSSNFTTDSYGSVRTCEKTNLIDLKALYGTCVFRDTITTTGTGSVSNNNANFVLSVTNGADSACLQSTERGAYVAGFVCEYGCGLQVDSSLFTGAQTLEFGYHDAQNGYSFVLDKNGVTLRVRKGGLATDIPSSQWNGDFQTHANINTARGLVYTISFSYYGYGSVLFGTAYSDVSGAQVNRLLHSYSAPMGQSCSQPHLPLTTTLSANGTAGPISVYLGGRQFSIIGHFNPQYRLISFPEEASAVMSTAWSHVVSYKKVDVYKACAMNVYSVDVITTQPVLLCFRTATVLTGPTWSAPTDDSDCIPTANGLLRDTTATATGGIMLYTKLLPAGYTSFDLVTAKLKIRIDDRIFSVMAKAVAATADVTIMLRMQENY